MQYDQQVEDAHDYDDNANYDDVFETKHIEILKQIEQHYAAEPYNSNYKIYFDDEYIDQSQNAAPKISDYDRVSIAEAHT